MREIVAADLIISDCRSKPFPFGRAMHNTGSVVTPCPPMSVRSHPHQVADQLYNFLVEFLSDRPDLAGRDFYVTGALFRFSPRTPRLLRSPNLSRP